jgi:putative effector of murein hydrolase
MKHQMKYNVIVACVITIVSSYAHAQKTSAEWLNQLTTLIRAIETRIGCDLARQNTAGIDFLGEFAVVYSDLLSAVNKQRIVRY